MSTATGLLFSRLVDDASMFPPGDLPLSDAVPAHRDHRQAPYADLVGTFVCTDRQLANVARRARETSTGPVRVSVVVTGGAGGIEPVVKYGDRSDDVEVAGVEIRLRDEDDLSRNALRVVRMCDSCMDSESAFVETGMEGGWERALDVIADAGYAAKLRTGGLEADLFPGAAQVAEFIEACLDREVQFKCTAGLHNAVRHTAPDTGFEHHGFLNVLLATRASLDGAPADEVAAVLENRDGADLARQAAALDELQAKGVRRWFTSFGSCSVSEPVEDLTGLGLVEL
jgi:hypothetical protein